MRLDFAWPSSPCFLGQNQMPLHAIPILKRCLVNTGQKKNSQSHARLLLALSMTVFTIQGLLNMNTAYLKTRKKMLCCSLSVLRYAGYISFQYFSFYFYHVILSQKTKLFFYCTVLYCIYRGAALLLQDRKCFRTTKYPPLLIIFMTYGFSAWGILQSTERTWNNVN